MSVRTTGTSSCRTNSSASCDAIRPAPTTPTLVTFRASDLSGAPAGPLGPLVHQVERVEGGPQLVAHQQVGQRVVLGRRPGRERLVADARAGQVQQLDRPQRARGGVAGAAGHDRPGAGDRVVPGAAVDLRPGDGAPRRRATPTAHSSDRSRKSAGSKSASAMPSFAAFGRRRHLVLRQRVLDDHRDGGVDADQVRQQLGAAPAGDQAEEDLGEGDDRGRRDRPVLAVQRQLQAAAERRAVDERERRDRRVLQPAEHPVPGLGDLPRLRGIGHRRNAGEVRADGEDERLAGHADRHRGGGVGRDLVQGGVQRGQPAGAERRGLGVVVPVVERDQRELAGQAGQPQEADLGGRHDLVLEDSSHLAAPSQFGFSQITVAPMPRPTHMAVRP